MRIAVTGGRDHHPTRSEMRAFGELWQACDGDEILHGAQRGVDSLVSWWAWITFGADPIPVPVNHEVDGPWPAAGPRRNGRMLGMGATALIAFPGGRGTADCVRQARAKGIPVYFVSEEQP